MSVTLSAKLNVGKLDTRLNDIRVTQIVKRVREIGIGSLKPLIHDTENFYQAELAKKKFVFHNNVFPRSIYGSLLRIYCRCAGVEATYISLGTKDLSRRTVLSDGIESVTYVVSHKIVDPESKEELTTIHSRVSFLKNTNTKLVVRDTIKFHLVSDEQGKRHLGNRLSVYFNYELDRFVTTHETFIRSIEYFHSGIHGNDKSVNLKPKRAPICILR